MAKMDCRVILLPYQDCIYQLKSGRALLTADVSPIPLICDPTPILLTNIFHCEFGDSSRRESLLQKYLRHTHNFIHISNFI